MVFVWGGAETVEDESGSRPRALNDGAAYDPASDLWSPIAGAPEGRFLHQAFWTGAEMIVFGGNGGPFESASVMLYDPRSDRWRKGAPAPLRDDYHVAVWTGRLLLVWGSAIENLDPCVPDRAGVLSCSRSTVEGAAYDPAANRWLALSPGPLAPRIHFAMAWTGDRMLVWGGGTPALDRSFVDGAAYDPVTDTWKMMAPSPLAGRIAPVKAGNSVWTGGKLLVWGGFAAEGGFSDGASYDPARDAWSKIATAPSRLAAGKTIWTGTSMVVVAGIDGHGDPAPSSGVAYDPTSNRWSRLPAGPGPPTGYAAGAWTGTDLVLVGGVDFGPAPPDSARPTSAVARFRPLR